jgi:histone deacetylase 1/2
MLPLTQILIYFIFICFSSSFFFFFYYHFLVNKKNKRVKIWVMTHPNICFAIYRVCQFMHAATDSHWATVKLILRYLRDTASHGLHITRSSSFALHGFTDADWAGNVEDRKSTGGYLVFFGQKPISWKSGKQRIVARSSTEAEYKALADDTTEVI